MAHDAVAALRQWNTGDLPLVVLRRPALGAMPEPFRHVALLARFEGRANARDHFLGRGFRPVGRHDFGQIAPDEIGDITEGGKCCRIDLLNSQSVIDQKDAVGAALEHGLQLLTCGAQGRFGVGAPQIVGRLPRQQIDEVQLSLAWPMPLAEMCRDHPEHAAIGARQRRRLQRAHSSLEKHTESRFAGEALALHHVVNDNALCGLQRCAARPRLRFADAGKEIEKRLFEATLNGDPQGAGFGV